MIFFDRVVLESQVEESGLNVRGKISIEYDFGTETVNRTCCRCRRVDFLDSNMGVLKFIRFDRGFMSVDVSVFVGPYESVSCPKEIFLDYKETLGLSVYCPKEGTFGSSKPYFVIN